MKPKQYRGYLAKIMNQPTIDVSANLPQDGMLQSFAREDDVVNLFSISGVTQANEKALEAKVAAIAQAFLRAKHFSSEISAEQLQSQFQTSQIPLDPIDADEYFQSLTDCVVDHSINTASPRYIGHMTSAMPYFVRPLSRLIALLNQNLVKTETSKSLSPFERQALAMMHRLIYSLPDAFYETHVQNHKSTLGVMVSGGTLANITALWCACQRALAPKDNFAGIATDGLAEGLQAYGHKRAVIIGSELMHYSFKKAASLLGIGDRNLICIPTDHQHRVDLKQLRKVVDDCRSRNDCIIAIVGIAGTTDSGSVDPLIDIGEIAHAADTHFHVDAAWGGPTLFSAQYRDRLAGIELADSVTIDGHKQLYLPMGMGMVILRDPTLASHIETNAPYAVREKSTDLGKRTLEGSRPAMVLFLQAALHLLGQRGYGYLIDDGIHKAQYLASLIRSSPEFELLVEPELNLVLYRYIPEPLRKRLAVKGLSQDDQTFINEFNQSLQVLQYHSGRTFVSRTTLRTTLHEVGIPLVALRAVLANPLTTEQDICTVLDDQRAIAAQLASTTFANV